MSKWEELENAARAATPGAWAVGSSPFDQSRHIYGEFPVSDGEDSWLPLIASTDDGEVLVNHEANAAYIAAANPSAILELLAERDALKAEVEEWKQAAKTWEKEAERRSDRYVKCAAELDRIRALEPVAWAQRGEEGDVNMLFPTPDEAASYSDGQPPIALYALNLKESNHGS